jgi:1-acyl-sn-glycerol-3-phosphate acyltransferase
MRTAWVGVVVFTSTVYYGTIVLVASLVRARGNIYSNCTRKWGRAIMRASGIPVTVEGLENLRRKAPQIVVSNHVSGFDIFALASVLPGPFVFIGKKELDKIPFFGSVWRAAGHISIDRSNRQKAIATLQEAGRRIREENSTVIVFPEGTRSRTGDLLPFKKGAFTLATEAAVPVIPTVVIGSSRIMRGGSWRVHPYPVTIRFGSPIIPPTLGAGKIDALVSETHLRMQQMLGEGRALLADRGV